ncbi:MAG TPA: hypothetical protein VD994_20260 [Prosthecobacter sp.]|nr:hypothetical protein [Prosthecobacter sp.]
MNLRFAKSVCLGAVLSFAVLAPAPAQEEKPSAVAEELRQNLVLPGVTLAEGVSEITGVAISPLLGVSALGAWKYWRTEESLRHRLPWYCSPYVWGTGLAILAICFLKDSLGAAAPMVVKKPLDFVELFEDKASALVAGAGFVPLVALAVAQYQRVQGPDQALNALAGSNLATMPMASIVDYTMHNPWVTVPVAIIAFAVVWLSSHAINVLIALSPFRLVDAGLKLTKLALITLVAGSAMLNPYLGAAVSFVFILIGLFIAGWSFRLTVFGTLMGRDLLLNKRATANDVRAKGVKAFLARGADGVPVRTYGKVKATETGETEFCYRPWIFFPERCVTLPRAGMVLCKGLLYSSLASHRGPDQRLRRTVVLLPRYRRLEETLAVHIGCAEVLDSPLMRGFKAMRTWLRSEAGGQRLEAGAS